METLDQQKTELRKKIRSLKSEFSFNDLRIKSKNVISNLTQTSNFTDAQTIFVYWSMNDEVNTKEPIEYYNQSKRFLLPVIQGDMMILKEFKGRENLIEHGVYKIAEPIGKEYRNFDEIDLIIVPGIAFDNNLNRLGRGKAYYDRFLKNTNCVKIGICFDFQLVESVPVNKYDIKLDMIISESKIIFPK